MHLQTEAVKRYDIWLILTTVVAAVCFFGLSLQLTPQGDTRANYSQLKYLTLEQDDLSLSEVRSVKDGNWENIKSPVNLGLSNAVHWFKLELAPIPSDAGGYFLQVDYPLIDSLSVAVYDQTATQPKVVFKAGDGHEVLENSVPFNSPVFPLPSSEQPQLVILSAETSGAVRVPIHVWHERDIIDYSSRKFFVLGVFIGFLCAMGLGHFFLFITTKSLSFGYYSGYLISLTLTLVSLHGVGYNYWWQDFSGFQHRGLVLFANMTVMFGLAFAGAMLPLTSLHKMLPRVFQGIFWLFALFALLSLIAPYHLMLQVLFVMGSGIALAVFTLSMIYVVKGETIARFLAFGWVFLLLSVIVASAEATALITLPYSAGHILMVGALVETSVLSLVLAIRYAFRRTEIYDAQSRVLEQERQANLAKEKLLEAQQQHKDELEYKVEERTLELEITLRELSETNEELKRLNAIDPLTGINNRRHFDKRLKNEGRRSRREQTYLSLAILDIDHFKVVNDTFGHDAGDECLRHVAKLFKTMLHRPTDDLCRIGGEEFAIILPNTEADGAFHVVESMREKLAQSPVNYEGQVINLTMSAGIATGKITSDEQHGVLYKSADEQLYESKNNGRNRVTVKQL